MALWRSHRIGRILRSIGISRRVGLRRRVRGSTHRPVVTRGACEHAPYATLPGIEPKAIAGNRREVGWCFGEVGGSRVGWRSFAGIKWPVQRVERQPADRRCPDCAGVEGVMGWKPILRMWGGVLRGGWVRAPILRERCAMNEHPTPWLPTRRSCPRSSTGPCPRTLGRSHRGRRGPAVPCGVWSRLP